MRPPRPCRVLVPHVKTSGAACLVEVRPELQGRSFTPSTCLIWIAVSNTRAHAEPGAEPITETAPESPESETDTRAGQRKGERITETTTYLPFMVC